ncbi:helix-turn-helix domain-containing protein [Nocardia arthritidis]|uniref:Helix-turn-helix domain-containing protein n=1 Tax=Nocardia arthritidis TaxID=228602 RepID=A0A6G9YC16_9NOCA|nr:helix-turn-helix transcriptional regulator [Nocardia arthritidis]QIS10617.1 helix-turn-helix domain-containing protein [Nocardia arthritidis]
MGNVTELGTITGLEQLMHALDRERRRAKVTQQAIAHHLGVSRSYIAKLFEGGRNPLPEHFPLILEFIGVDNPELWLQAFQRTQATNAEDFAVATAISHTSRPTNHKRCLIMSPSGVDLTSLTEILSLKGLETVLSSDLGAGAELSRVPLGEFDCGIGIIPTIENTRDSAVTSIYMEIGICLGKELPLLVIVEPPGDIPPALSGVMVANSLATNVSALNLHTGIFLRGLHSPTAPSFQSLESEALTIPGLNVEISVPELSKHIDKARKGPRAGAVAVDSLKALFAYNGAYVVSGVDEYHFAAQVPNLDLAWGDGTVIVSVKTRSRSSNDLLQEENRLSEYVRSSGSSLGLLVYVEPISSMLPDFGGGNLVLTTTIDDLFSSLESQPLGAFLRHARNLLVHGLR